MKGGTLPPLAENTGLAFSGEPAWLPAVLTDRQREVLRAAKNPSGRPNSDALRGFLGRSGNRLRERWQVDFASHLTAQEAALYAAPFALLKKKCTAATDRWWVNPQANPAMRTALAKLDRFLVTPIAANKPAWSWVDAGWLPDDSLLAVARDDDFAHGLLQSRIFSVWWQDCRETGPVTLILESFPFPWPPRTPVGSLTAIQQDLRSGVARAARTGETAQLDSAVATAYGWPADLDDAELLTRLLRLHDRRAAADR